jgi:hypothetical protein
LLKPFVTRGQNERGRGIRSRLGRANAFSDRISQLEVWKNGIWLANAACRWNRQLTGSSVRGGDLIINGWPVKAAG